MKLYKITITVPFMKENEIKIKNKVIAVVANTTPTRFEIAQVNEQTYEHELEEIQFGYSGTRKYENIKKEMDELTIEYETAKEAIKRNMVTVEFVKKF